MLAPFEILLITLWPAGIAAVVVWFFTERRDGDEPSHARDKKIRPAIDRFKDWRSAVIWCLAVTLPFVSSYVAYEIRAKYVAATTGYGAADANPLKEACEAVVQSSLHPIEAKHRIPSIGIALLMLTALLAALRNRLAMLSVTSVAGVALVARQLWTSIYVTQRWSTTESALWLGGTGGMIGILWWTLCGSSDSFDRTKFSRLFTCGVIAVMLSVTLASSGSITYGAIAAALGASLVGGMLSGLCLRRSGDRLGWSGPFVIFAGMLLVLGCAFSELRMIHAVMFATAMGLSGIPSTDNRGKLGRQVLFCAVALTPAAAATAWAVLTALAQANAASDNPYDAYL